MTTKKRSTAGKAVPGKLKLKKETIKDLDGRVRDVKGGAVLSRVCLSPQPCPASVGGQTAINCCVRLP